MQTTNNIITFKDISLNTNPPIECDLKIGDTVIFTNDYGVSFFGHKVTGFSDTVENGRFVHLDDEAYWFSVKRESLVKMSHADQIKQLNRDKGYSSMPRLLKLADNPQLLALVNGYKINWNSFFNHFTLSHDEIGVVEHHHDFDYICEEAIKG